MRAGNLGRSIAIQRPTTGIDMNGTPMQTWTSVASVKAQLVSNSIDERHSEGPKTQATNAFRIYWRGDISIGYRVIYDGQAYDILQIVELGRRVGLDLKCQHVGPL